METNAFVVQLYRGVVPHDQRQPWIWHSFDACCLQERWTVGKSDWNDNCRHHLWPLLSHLGIYSQLLLPLIVQVVSVLGWVLPIWSRVFALMASKYKLQIYYNFTKHQSEKVCSTCIKQYNDFRMNSNANKAWKQLF